MANPHIMIIHEKISVFGIKTESDKSVSLLPMFLEIYNHAIANPKPTDKIDVSNIGKIIDLTDAAVEVPKARIMA